MWRQLQQAPAFDRPLLWRFLPEPELLLVGAPWRSDLGCGDVYELRDHAWMATFEYPELEFPISVEAALECLRSD